MRPPVEEAPPAILAVALNPFRRLDKSYGRFLGLLARRLESVMSASFALDLARTRREAHAALRAAADRAAFLSDLGEALRLIEDPEAVMAEAAARLGRRLGTARCAFSEIEPDSGILTFACDWTDGRLPPAPRSLPLADLDPALVAHLSSGETLALSDLLADPNLSPAHRATAQAFGQVRADLAVPLIKGGRWVATLALQDTVPRDWPSEEQALVREVAERTWSALEAAHAARALREGQAFTDDILEASNDCIKVLDLDGRFLFMSGGGRRMMEMAPDAPLPQVPWPQLWSSDIRPLA